MAVRKARWLVPLVAVAFVAFGATALGQEHPKEHPKGAEHPKEHPKGEAKAAVTKEDLGAAVEAHVKQESEKNGAFTVDDPVDKKKLSLTLKMVHKDKLSQVGPDTYFACADFAAADGTTYDLDIFMKGPNKNSLQATEVSVHKKNGVERYTWMEEGGVWKKKEMATAGSHEHPKEHPKGKEHPQTKP
jgi:hypothetical protein